VKGNIFTVEEVFFMWLAIPAVKGSRIKKVHGGKNSGLSFKVGRQKKMKAHLCRLEPRG